MQHKKRNSVHGIMIRETQFTESEKRLLKIKEIHLIVIIIVIMIMAHSCLEVVYGDVVSYQLEVIGLFVVYLVLLLCFFVDFLLQLRFTVVRY